MFKDRALIWILEYIFGGALVLISLADMWFRVSVQTDVHIWAAHLFVVCLGVVLISCSSSMRQRMLLGRRIEMLTKRLEKLTANVL
jgi:hypothetical protein